MIAGYLEAYKDGKKQDKATVESHLQIVFGFGSYGKGITQWYDSVRCEDLYSSSNDSPI